LSAISDQEILKRVLMGDVAEYARLFDRYGRMAYAMAAARLRDRTEATDVVRSVFLLAYERLGSISHPVPRFAEVLQSLTVEVCRDRLRDRQATSWILRVPPEKAARAGASLDLEAVLGDLPDEDAAKVLAEQAVGVPRQYEVPFLLRFLEGLSYSEIGKALGVPISEVEELVDRGRRLHEREIRFHLEKIAGEAS
jgi:RNA polymerase sigma-70 factor, ECF subfamily